MTGVCIPYDVYCALPEAEVGCLAGFLAEIPGSFVFASADVPDPRGSVAEVSDALASLEQQGQWPRLCWSRGASGDGPVGSYHLGLLSTVEAPPPETFAEFVAAACGQG